MTRLIPWKAILTGAICLLLALLVSVYGAVLRHEYPWIFALSWVVNFGVILGGLRTILEITKTANELRTMELEVEKLNLEIVSLKKAAAKEEARVTLATPEEVEKYQYAPGRKYRRQLKTISLAVVITALIGLTASQLEQHWYFNPSDVPLFLKYPSQEKVFRCHRGTLTIRSYGVEYTYPFLNPTADLEVTLFVKGGLPTVVHLRRYPDNKYFGVIELHDVDDVSRAEVRVIALGRSVIVDRCEGIP